MNDTVQTQAVLFELTGVGVVETDMTTGRLVWVDQTFCKMVGYNEAELRGMTNAELTHPDDWGHDAELFEQLQLGEVDQATTLTRCLRKDKEVVWLELHVTLIRDGDEVRNIAIVNDVTERKRAEVALRELNETLEQACRGAATPSPIREAMSDAGWFSHRIMERLADLRAGDDEATERVELFKREREVLERLARA